MFICVATFLSGQPKSADTASHKQDRKQNNSGSAPFLPLREQTQSNPFTNTSEQSAEKIDNETKLARYTKDLADYTKDVATFTKVLVIVSALQFVALIWQAWVLHGHSGHLRDSVQQMMKTVATYRRYVAVAIVSARAAKASTEALINIERPWIMVKQIYPPPLIADQKIRFEFDIENRGRTPAKVIGVWAKLDAVKNITDLAIPPDYTTSADQPEEDVPPFGWMLSVHETRHLCTPYMGFSALGIKEVQQVNLIWIFYGLVKYIDAAERLHESQFSYIYYVPSGEEPIPLEEGWRQGGPKEYNRYT
jgi:hypothetical protein